MSFANLTVLIPALKKTVAFQDDLVKKLAGISLIQRAINKAIHKMINDDTTYIGVTATPARLDLNNTFETENEEWVYFRHHLDYVGKNDFFLNDSDDNYQRYNVTSNEKKDLEKDYEIIPYSPDEKENRENIAEFMVKYITKPFEYLDNTIGVEINFNKVFYKPQKLRPVSKISEDLERLENDLSKLENQMTL